MSKLIQRYQSEFGMAVMRELQRNQERSRRGSTPLEPSLGQNEARSNADATAKSNAAQSNAQYYAAQDAQWRADTAQYNGSVYTNQQIANLQSQINSLWASNMWVPSGASIMWDMAGGLPSGYNDTGYTINLAAGVNRRVIRKQ